MASAIPIENLYYLLSYAWDHFREGEEIDLSSTACPDLINLLAKVLVNGTDRLGHLGIDRQHLPFQEVTPRLRGRILVADSYRRMTYRSGTMECLFDELSTDTPANRILKSTLERLLCCGDLTTENRHAVRKARERLAEVGSVRLTDGSFHRIQLHRNNRHYRLLMHVCQLLHRSLLPEEHEGKRRFRDILRDETVMHRLFENFVLNFARRHCQGANVRAMAIDWHGTWGADAEEVLPKMITDVTIEWPHRKIILDCKFYKEALVTREDRLRLHSSHLYQLNAYLQNKARRAGWDDVEGILLYPAVKHHVDVSMILLDHAIRVVSVDLDQAWQEIHRQILGIVGIHRSEDLSPLSSTLSLGAPG